MLWCDTLVLYPFPSLRRRRKVPPKRPHALQKLGGVITQKTVKVLRLLVRDAELLGDSRRFGKLKCPHFHVKRHYSWCSLPAQTKAQLHFQTSGTIYPTTRRHTPKDMTPQHHRCYNLKYPITQLSCIHMIVSNHTWYAIKLSDHIFITTVL